MVLQGCAPDMLRIILGVVQRRHSPHFFNIAFRSGISSPNLLNRTVYVATAKLAYPPEKLDKVQTLLVHHQVVDGLVLAAGQHVDVAVVAEHRLAGLGGVERQGEHAHLELHALDAAGVATPAELRGVGAERKGVRKRCFVARRGVAQAAVPGGRGEVLLKVLAVENHCVETTMPSQVPLRRGRDLQALVLRR